MAATWLALAFLAVLSAAGVIFAGARAFALFRDLRRFRREVTRSLQEELAATAAGLEGRLGELAMGSARLQRALDRLQATLDRAAILSAAFRRAVEPIVRLRAAVPRK